MPLKMLLVPDEPPPKPLGDLNTRDLNNLLPTSLPPPPVIPVVSPLEKANRSASSLRVAPTARPHPKTPESSPQ